MNLEFSHIEVFFDKSYDSITFCDADLSSYRCNRFADAKEEYDQLPDCPKVLIRDGQIVA